MPRRPKFRVRETPAGWMVNVPKGLSLSGRRERHFHRTKELALKEARELRERSKEFGEKASSISPTLADQANQAAEILLPHGIGIVDAARIVATAEERLSSFGISILEAVERIAREEGETAASVDIEEAAEKFLAYKESDISEVHFKRIGYALRDLRTDFKGRKMASLKLSEIEPHISKHSTGARTFNHRLAILRSFWRWCAEEPRQWCKSNLLDTVKRKREVLGEVGILTPEEAAGLLETAERVEPACALPFAILLFAGVRRAELENLTASDIREDGIVISAKNSKTGRRRFVNMNEPLRAWIEAYPPPQNGPIVPSNWRRLELKVRREAGWRVWSPLSTPPEPPPGLPKWKHNCLRHTSASCLVALGCPLTELLFQHGHSGGEAVLKKHYAGLMSRKQAAEIWRIGPHGKQLPSLKAA